jgi:hypothetical protein
VTMPEQPWICPACQVGDCHGCDITTGQPLAPNAPAAVCACPRCNPVLERVGLDGRH